MPRRDLPQRNVLADLARIGAGLGTVAMLASAAFVSRKRQAKPDMRTGTRGLDAILRDNGNRRRKPPEAGIPIPAVPPTGPLPKQGGAEAPLDLAR